MAINKVVKNIMKVISNDDDQFDLIKSRKLVCIKAIDPLKNFYKTVDSSVEHDGFEIPVRIYFPGETKKNRILLFFHGGGFVTENVETYNRICRNLSKETDTIVLSVDYRLAPEHRFPVGLEDCYAVAKALYNGEIIGDTQNDDITLIGDSAGGNFAAALSLMARDRGDFDIKKEILIYPCTDNDYSENSKYPSVIENGTDFLLTRSDLIKYMELYRSSEEDYENPYFSPIKAKDFSNLPKTLVITGEFDPLRDEGEAYAEKLLEAGNDVIHHRIADAIHGFFAYSTKLSFTKQCMEYIKEFIAE